MGILPRFTLFLWTFMGYSTTYSTFTGIAEVAAGLFLFSRKTTTLGTLFSQSRFKQCGAAKLYFRCSR